MGTRLPLLAVLLTSLVLAETRFTIEQLTSFIRSAIQLKQPDKQVADYLRKEVKLVNRLDPDKLEELRGMGAGPQTYEALARMVELSKDLPAPPVVPKKTVVAIARPSAEEQAKLLNEVREYALDYVKRLPNFICLQVARRYFDPAGMEIWHLADTVTTKLTYFEQKEDYKVITINNRSTDLAYDKLSGASSSGEFGTLMKEIFNPETQTRFEWDRWGTLRGRRVHVFNYRVLQAYSKWHVNYQRTEDIVPGYSGQIMVDKEFPAVLRITMEADDIPPSFPIQRAATVLDFDYIKIGEQESLLPLKYTMNMREGRMLVKNDVEFRGYRKYSAESVITFNTDTPPPLPDDKMKEDPGAAKPQSPPPTKK